MLYIDDEDFMEFLYELEGKTISSVGLLRMGEEADRPNKIFRYAEYEGGGLIGFWSYPEDDIDDFEKEYEEGFEDKGV